MLARRLSLHNQTPKNGILATPLTHKHAASVSIGFVTLTRSSQLVCHNTRLINWLHIQFDSIVLTEPVCMCECVWIKKYHFSNI